MCGRYTFATRTDELQIVFPDFTFPDDLPRRYNIAPSQDIPAVANTGENKVETLRWGLVPFWAKDPKIGNRTINARSETAAEKPAFRNAYRKRRCLILADGFYEWRKEPDGKTKTPVYIRLKSGRPFVFAGLWDTWDPEDAPPLRSCTILTTRPNALMKQIHDRMPVILPPDAYARWLDPESQASGALDDLLVPYPENEMTAHPVSRRVNNPRVDTPECIEPVEPETGNTDQPSLF